MKILRGYPNAANWQLVCVKTPITNWQHVKILRGYSTALRALNTPKVYRFQ